MIKIEDKSGLAFDYLAGTEFYIASEFKVNGLDARVLKAVTPKLGGQANCYIVVLKISDKETWCPTPWLNIEILNELHDLCCSSSL